MTNIRITTNAEADVPRGIKCGDCDEQVGVPHIDFCSFFRRDLNIDNSNGDILKCFDCRVSCATQEGKEADTKELKYDDNPYSRESHVDEHDAWTEGFLNGNIR